MAQKAIDDEIDVRVWRQHDFSGYWKPVSAGLLGMSNKGQKS